MCGYIVTNQKISLVHSYLAATNYRGPDATIAKSVDDISFGFNRLAFQGVGETGMQPMQYGDRWTIVYNGEIYNTGELKKILSDSGRTFVNASGSDTEILLAFLIYCAETNCFHMLTRIDGIYSFVLYDSLQGVFYFCTDEFGVKPQFFLFNESGYVICSDLSYFKDFENYSLDVLKKYVECPQSLSPVDLYNEFSESEPGTLYKYQIKTHTLSVIHNARVNFPTGYSCLKNIFKIGSKINEAVKRNSVGDYPICYLLSGGVDSSLISLYAECHNQSSHSSGLKIDTFSVEFSDDPFSEKSYRQKVLSIKPKLKGNEINVDADSYISALVQYINQSRRLPVIPNEVALYMLFKAISSSGYRVAISGEGADEIFNGYHYIRDAAIINYINRIASLYFIGPYLADFLYSLSPRFKHYSSNPLSLLEHITDDQAYYDKSTRKYRLNVVKNILIKKYLRGLLYRADNASMLNSIELRVPFLSKVVVNAFNCSPSNFASALLSPKFLLKVLLASKLGYSFAFSKKRGFSVPWLNWYMSSPNFRNLWGQTKSDPLIKSIYLIPENIESDSEFNNFFEKIGFRLMCIFIYKSDRISL